MSVLISPLWAITRYGWASSQLGKVFVLKREWTSASALLKRGSLQVGEEAARLRGHEHPLPDDRRLEERGGVEVRARRELDDAADDVELALERVLVVRRSPAPASTNTCRMSGRVRLAVVADVVLVDRDVAPAEEALALDADVELDELLELLAPRRVLRQEADADAVLAGRRQLEVDDRRGGTRRASARASRRRRR